MKSIKGQRGPQEESHMGMPDHLLLVRHGESEGNVATNAAKDGDLQHYTEAFLTTPGHRWRLTAQGQEQARTAGAWITAQMGPSFDQYYVSPYVRTRQTAAHLNLPGAQWLLNRALRERDWGDIGSRPITEFRTRPEFEFNAANKELDPLYWAAPNGESIAQVAEDRVRNVLSTLHREAGRKTVIAVSHGDAMWAFRLVLERMSDEEFVTNDADKSQRIHNCQVLHYTRINPEDGQRAGRLSWLRRAWPLLIDGQWTMIETPWINFERAMYSNSELLASAEDLHEAP